MMGSLGRGFGAATAGLVANAAGLGAGVSTETVAVAATWVYGLAIAVPAAIAVLSLRLLRLHRGPRDALPELRHERGATRPREEAT